MTISRHFQLVRGYRMRLSTFQQLNKIDESFLSFLQDYGDCEPSMDPAVLPSVKDPFSIWTGP